MLYELKTFPVLYIDDFLKGGITDADIRLAFELLNYRYNNSSLLTIISSEVDLKNIFDADEALAGRIYERAKGNIYRTPNEDWRLKNG
jgi:DNA replication protein DnaC